MYAAHYKAPFAKGSIRLMANEAPLFIWVFSVWIFSLFIALPLSAACLIALSG